MELTYIICDEDTVIFIFGASGRNRLCLLHMIVWCLIQYHKVKVWFSSL